MAKRKGFSAPQAPPAKLAKSALNKRIVFSDDDDDDDKENVRQSPDPVVQPTFHSDEIDFDHFSLNEDARIWPYLELRGPLPKTTCLSKELIQNQEFVAYFRSICKNLHQNFIKFRNKRLMGLTMKNDKPGVGSVLAILNEMKQETLRIGKVHLDFVGIQKTIKTVLKTGQVKVLWELFEPLRDQFRKLFAERKFAISEKDLHHIFNAFARFFLLIAADLCSTILTLRLDNFTKVPQIKGYRSFEIFYPYTILTRSDNFALTEAASLRDVNTFFLLKRSEGVSLWTAIPCEQNEHLLKHVFEPGIIPLFPKNVKEFLMTWMIGVRKRMKKRIEKGDLLRTIEAILETNNQNRNPIRIDFFECGEVGQYLEIIMGNVLNCVDGFDIYGGEWSTSVISFLQNPMRQSSDARVGNLLKFSSIDTPATQFLSSLFSNSVADRNLFTHIRLQLFRFLAYFAIATLRHVFRLELDGIGPESDPELVFDWDLEGEITDSSESIENEGSENNSFLNPKIPEPETSGKIRTLVKTEIQNEPEKPEQKPLIQVMRPRKILLPTPFISSAQPPPPQKLYTPPPSNLPYPAPPNLASMPPQQPPSFFFNNIPPPAPPQQFPVYFGYSNYPNQQPRMEQTRELIPPFQPLPPSAFLVHPTTETPRLPSAEVPERKPLNVQAPRAPAEVNADLQDSSDDDEGIPKKWVNAYRLLVEWNNDLKAELENVKHRLKMLS